ncbi:MAG: methyltransferase, partial [Nitrolancea sp.]
MSESDQVNIFALSDFATPWSIHVLATLRVADHIASGVDSIDELAAVCGADADMLRRVLEHAVVKGVFLQPEAGRFALNEPAQMLRDGPMRLGLDLDGIGGRFALAWSGLLRQVRTGKPAYAETFGLPFWEDLNAHPDLGAGFDALMGPAGHGVPDPEVLVSGDWDEVRTVVDVGGGTGALLAAILQEHPHLHGIL